MISAALDRVPVHIRVDFVYLLLVVAAFGAGAAASLAMRAPTITRVQHVGATVKAGSPAEVASAWGKPDATVPGAQVNSQLAGLTCYVWQSKRAILCY